ncbi:MAG: cadmium-translocating P-type ATPase [Treponema sp.]|jgi:Cd2+/Zn2+-exporting ATPase|nr:cadmium-translocating P-type ATPase [Treponema sp.]
MKKYINKFCLGLGIALFAAGVFFKPEPDVLRLAVFIASWLLIGGGVVLQAVRNIARGRVFDENFLMTIATIGAFAIGEYPEAAAVMLFYRIGEAFQEMAVERSMRSITSLMDLRPDYANVRRGGEVARVSPVEVRIGETIIVKPGEKIPLDGIVAEGSSALDTSALTGEAMPRDVEPGGEAFAGSINKSGLLAITVTKLFADSAVSKIFELVRDTESRKAPVENFITRFARYYTPAVVFAAAALAVLPTLFLPGAEFSHWLKRALVFLVVSCPCALVISIPLSFFGGIGGASRQGILIKGGGFLSALNDVETVVFDKTGTLTKGQFAVSEALCENGISREELLYYAAAAESNSSHPIARSVLNAYEGKIAGDDIALYEEIPGKGISARVGGKNVLAGNAHFLESRGVALNAISAAGTAVYVALDGVYAGCLVVADEVKPDARKAVEELRRAGVRRLVMLSGDNRAAAEKTGRELGLDEVYPELLPHEKVRRLELLKGKTRAGKKTAFVGDGINDAPALALSDIGIAMGGLGSDAAIEAADIVLMTDEPLKLADALKIAKKTKSIVRQNIVFALGVKAVILVLGAFGIATMWEAVFGDVGVALIAVLNAMRAMRPAAGSAVSQSPRGRSA